MVIVVIALVALWALLFLPIVALPFLPQVDTAYAPAPQQLAKSKVLPIPANQREQAA